ncbi:hypothetical protein ACH3XW_3805 [Acanthocheilonema viteae]
MQQLGRIRKLYKWSHNMDNRKDIEEYCSNVRLHLEWQKNEQKTTINKAYTIIILFTDAAYIYAPKMK